MRLKPGLWQEQHGAVLCVRVKRAQFGVVVRDNDRRVRQPDDRHARLQTVIGLGTGVDHVFIVGRGAGVIEVPSTFPADQGAALAVGGRLHQHRPSVFVGQAGNAAGVNDAAGIALKPVRGAVLRAGEQRLPDQSLGAQVKDANLAFTFVEAGDLVAVRAPRGPGIGSFVP